MFSDPVGKPARANARRPLGRLATDGSLQARESRGTRDDGSRGDCALIPRASISGTPSTSINADSDPSESVSRRTGSASQPLMDILIEPPSSISCHFLTNLATYPEIPGSSTSTWIGTPHPHQGAIREPDGCAPIQPESIEGAQDNLGAICDGRCRFEAVPPLNVQLRRTLLPRRACRNFGEENPDGVVGPRRGRSIRRTGFSVSVLAEDDRRPSPEHRRPVLRYPFLTEVTR